MPDPIVPPSVPEPTARDVATADAVDLCARAADHLRAGRRPEAAELAQAALDRYPGGPPHAWQVEARSLLGSVRRHQGRHAEAAALARETIELSRRLGSANLEAVAHNNLAMVLFTLGEHDQALSHWLEALAAIEADDTEESVRLRVYLNGNVAELHADGGDHVRAVEHLSSALVLARRVGDARLLLLFGRKHAVCLRRVGRGDEARAQLEEVLPHAEGPEAVGGAAAWCRAELALLDGDRAGAAAHYRAALEQERGIASERQAARLGLDLAAALDLRSDEALALALAASRRADVEVGCGGLKLDALELLSVLHEARDELGAALRCAREAAGLRRALFDQASHRRQDELQARFDLAQRSWEARWHRTQNEALVQRVEERTRELVEANRRLEIARDRAEAADRTKSGFLAAASHELRTPLNAIIGYAELVREELADAGADDVAPSAGRILESARRLLHLVDRILQMTNLDAGATRILAASVPLAPLIGEVVREVGGQRGNALVASCDPALVPCTDGTLLRSVVFNLVENADKFTSGGEVHVGARREGDLLVVAVEDTGIGMTADDLRRIFHPFTQLESGFTRRFEGLGLGLALGRRYCQLLGGDLQVRSEPGRGSTFEVRIPYELG